MTQRNSNCDKCEEHSGFMARIDGVEKETSRQWTVLERIGTRINQVLGAVLVTLIAAIINLIVIGVKMMG